MKRLVFVIWMLGWPLYLDISLYLSRNGRGDKTYGPDLLTALTVVTIWVWVGVLLWKSKD